MNMDQARKMLRHALDNGLQLHGISSSGKPAISFNYDHPGAEMSRRRFLATNGLVRELLRAAMIDECLNRGLPDELPLSTDHLLMSEADLPQAARVH